MGAKLYTDIKEKNEESVFTQISKRPATFTLRRKLNVKNAPISLIEEEVVKPTDTYHERELHKVLSSYAYASKYFSAYTKTIFHEKSGKTSKGKNKWIHPDMVGVRYSFQIEREVLGLKKEFNVPLIKLFSFEIKKELDFDKLRQYFFQAVSNSSWANEGYLVAAKIPSDEDFRDELRMLTESFGIGVIELNKSEFLDSKIIFPAKIKEHLDWEIINRLASENEDFKSFLDAVRRSVQAQALIQFKYDERFEIE